MKKPNLLRWATSPFRLLPDFLIIGAKKAGTTSLYRYLIEHPAVLPAFKKEAHFFDLDFCRGLSWYRASFSMDWNRRRVQKRLGLDPVTGEATPYYLDHPLVPQRVRAVLPHAKLITLLRNPVDRAYSHYHHELRKKRETVSFEEALEMEEKGLRGDDPTFSYISRGIYAERLRAWFSYFPRNQMLILKSEDFMEDPAGTLKRVFEFLEIPFWEIRSFPKYHESHYPPMIPSTRKRLAEYFKPHNERLTSLVGFDFGWESETATSDNHTLSSS